MGVIALLAVGLSLLLAGCSSSDDSQADLVVVGSIRTMDPLAPVAEVMAITGGKIILIGDAQHARARLGVKRRIIQLAPEQIAMPGMVDSHVHMLEGGTLQLDCAIAAPPTREALYAAITACVDAHPDVEWVLGSGWPVGLFDEHGPRKEDLDALVPDRPAVFFGEDGHSAWLNSEALRVAEIGPTTPDPPLGRIERKPGSNEPSGTLRETAVELIKARIPPTSPAKYLEGLKIGQALLHSLGITLIQDANVNPRALEAYSEAAKSDVLTMKVVAAQATDPLKPASQVDELVALRDRFAGGRLSASSAKLFLDGVLEARTAALLEPYNDDGAGDDRGIANWSPEKLAEIAIRLEAAGFQIHMHAIGDRAIRDGLDALAAACAAKRAHDCEPVEPVTCAANDPSDLRHHMAHLELADPDDIPRLAKLCVVANFQPFWMFEDDSIKVVEPLIGPVRSQRLYSIRSFQAASARIVAGSDWPVSTPNPFLAMQVGITHRDPADPSAPVWNPDQRVSLDTLVAAYTIEGAFVNHRENETGSLVVGKAADFIILDRDLFAVPPDQIGKTRVLATFVDGVQVYAASAD